MAGGDRSGADSALLAALAAGKTVQEAAALSGVSERTAWRRMADDAFRGQVRDARAEMVQQAVGVLSASATAAATTLASLSQSAEGESVRLGASRAVLDQVIKLVELTELAQRVAQLEQAAAQDATPLRRMR